MHNAAQISLGHVQWLTLELEHSLELGETPLTGASTSRIPFDDKQFRARGIVCVTAQKLLRQRRVYQFAIFLRTSTRQFFDQQSLVTSFLHLLNLLQPVPGRALIMLKPLFQPLVNHRTHNAFNRRVVQTILGLTLKLRVRQFDRDDHV